MGCAGEDLKADEARDCAESGFYGVAVGAPVRYLAGIFMIQVRAGTAEGEGSGRAGFTPFPATNDGCQNGWHGRLSA